MSLAAHEAGFFMESTDEEFQIYDDWVYAFADARRQCRRGRWVEGMAEIPDQQGRECSW